MLCHRLYYLKRFYFTNIFHLKSKRIQNTNFLAKSVTEIEKRRNQKRQTHQMALLGDPLMVIAINPVQRYHLPLGSGLETPRVKGRLAFKEYG